MHTELAALNRSVLIVEVVIAVVIVALLIGIVVASRRRKKATAPKTAVEPTNYYADLQQQPSGRHDPFGRFAAAPAQTGNGTTARSPMAASPMAASPMAASPMAASPPAANPMAASPTSASPVFTAPASTSYPTEAVGASNTLDLTAPGAGTPPESVYAPSEASQGAAPAWTSDPWAAGSGVATTYQADAYRLDVQPSPAPVAVAPAPDAPSPPPGTPAGWLPDPNGIPDTLRYWDGSAWTQHFAQRS